jgi:uncharacterized damage-inducible protein DinB
MPLESTPRPIATPTDLGAAYLAEGRAALQSSLAKIEHCLGQLSDDDLWWRPDEAANSVQNILLHLCGNLRQWLVHGVGGAADERDRPQEFAERTPIPKAELLRRLREAVAAGDAALAGFDAKRLLEPRRIQGFDSTYLGAIFDTVSHCVGHTHQVVYITRLRLGPQYRFQWAPAGKEQGA